MRAGGVREQCEADEKSQQTCRSHVVHSLRTFPSRYGVFGIVGELGCSTRTSSARRSAAVENVSRDNVTRRVLPVLRWTTSAAHADFSHQQEPICHGKPAAASTLLTSSVQFLSVIGGTVTELCPVNVTSSQPQRRLRRCRASDLLSPHLRQPLRLDVRCDVSPEHRRFTVHAGAEFKTPGSAVRGADERLTAGPQQPPIDHDGAVGRRGSELRIHRVPFPTTPVGTWRPDTTTARSRGSDAQCKDGPDERSPPSNETLLSLDSRRGGGSWSTQIAGILNDLSKSKRPTREIGGVTVHGHDAGRLGNRILRDAGVE